MRTLPKTLPGEFADHRSTDQFSMHEVNVLRRRLGLPDLYPKLLAPWLAADGTTTGIPIPTRAGGLQLPRGPVEVAAAAVTAAAARQSEPGAGASDALGSLTSQQVGAWVVCEVLLMVVAEGSYPRGAATAHPTARC